MSDLNALLRQAVGANRSNKTSHLRPKPTAPDPDQPPVRHKDASAGTGVAQTVPTTKPNLNDTLRSVVGLRKR